MSEKKPIPGVLAPQIHSELSAARDTLDQLLRNPRALDQIEAAATLMAQALAAGKKIIACGNGGSMCDAMHFATELSGRFREARRPLPAVAISDPAYLTATANDFGYEKIFSRFVEAIGDTGDILLAISTSGNSPNVLQALKAARSRGMPTVALTGKDGGKMAGQADVEIRAPQSRYAERAQEIHIKVIHILTSLIERYLGLDAAP